MYTVSASLVVALFAAIPRGIAVFSLSKTLTKPLNTPVFLPVSVNRMFIAFEDETTPLHTLAVVVLILEVFHCTRPATTFVESDSPA